MNALAMPISSRTAGDRLCDCFRAKSARILDERCATSPQTLASFSVSLGSAGCIAHDAIRIDAALCPSCVVEVVQVGYRLAHREECLVGVERAAEQDREQLTSALGSGSQGFRQFL